MYIDKKSPPNTFPSVYIQSPPLSSSWKYLKYAIYSDFMSKLIKVRPFLTNGENPQDANNPTRRKKGKRNASKANPTSIRILCHFLSVSDGFKTMVLFSVSAASLQRIDNQRNIFCFLSSFKNRFKKSDRVESIFRGFDVILRNVFMDRAD